MIRCLVDEQSFDSVDHPHDDLEKLSSMIELAAGLIRANSILLLPDTFNIILTCDEDVCPTTSPGMHWAGDQTVFLNGRYRYADILYHLCHELIHVEQVAMEWLAWDEKLGALTWFGYPLQFNEDIPDEEYRNLPWERDAYRREKDVVKQFNKIIKDNVWHNDTDAINVASIESVLLN